MKASSSNEGVDNKRLNSHEILQNEKTENEFFPIFFEIYSKKEGHISE